MPKNKTLWLRRQDKWCIEFRYIGPHPWQPKMNIYVSENGELIKLRKPFPEKIGRDGWMVNIFPDEAACLKSLEFMRKVRDANRPKPKQKP